MGTPLPQPEYRAHFDAEGNYVSDHSVVTARRLNTSQSVSITFATKSGSSYSGTLTLSARYGQYWPDIWQLQVNGGPSQNYPLNIGSGGSQTVSATLSGFPEFVYADSLFLHYTLDPDVRVNDLALSHFTAHRLYQIYAAPNAPMSLPWIEVLNDACSWARGQSTYDAVARELTTGLFFSMYFVYDPSRRYWLGVGQDIFGNPVAFDHFNLGRFLQQTASHYVNGDCVDVSCYLTICANAVGLDFEVGMYNDPLSPYINSFGDRYFWTNPACGIGNWPALDSNYIPFDFVFHAPAFPKGTGWVYDAVCAQKEDLSGNGYRNPPFKWALNIYWQTPFGTRTLGLVDRPSGSVPNLMARFTPGVQ